MAVRLVALEPPGTHCQHQAVFDALRRLGGGAGSGRFVEVGCGDGSLAAKLCARGHRGVGLDFSEAALAVARRRAAEPIERGLLELRRVDFMDGAAAPASLGGFDIGLSMMVMEHVEDDGAFLERLIGLVGDGGAVLVGVPGRMDRWGIEDEQVGHLRRYERSGLEAMLRAAGLADVTVWSVSVPVANLLLPVGNALLARRPAAASRRRQTEASGVRRIPFKTSFPRFLRWLLHPVTLSPLFVLQRLFYRGDRGLTLLGFGRKPPAEAR